MSQQEIEALAKAMRKHARAIEDLKDAHDELSARLEALKTAAPSGGDKPKGGDDGNPF